MKDIVEPNAFNIGNGLVTPVDTTSLRSIAISLKRIADIMEGKTKPVLMTAEEFEYMKAKEADHEKS